MDELISQDVDAVQRDGEHFGGVVAGDGFAGGVFGASEAPFPLWLAHVAFLVFPEGADDIGVIQQCADGTGIDFPDQLFQTLTFIEGVELFQEGIEGGLLTQPLPVINFTSVGRVKGNPQEDETAVWVGFLLGPIQPAQGTVNAQNQVFRVIIPFLSLACFECFVPGPHIPPP